MDTAGSRVTSWHIRQDVSSSQGSGRGTRVLWVGGVARSSSWTPGLPRDMGALARDSGWRLFCVSGVPREAGLVFFRRIVCLFQGAPGLRHVRSYTGGLLAGTIKEYTSDGRSRILPINSSAQPVMGQGAPINHICSKDTPGKPSATPGSAWKQGVLAPFSATAWPDGESRRGGKCAAVSPRKADTGCPWHRVGHWKSRRQAPGTHGMSARRERSLPESPDFPGPALPGTHIPGALS